MRQLCAASNRLKYLLNRAGNYFRLVQLNMMAAVGGDDLFAVARKIEQVCLHALALFIELVAYVIIRILTLTPGQYYQRDVAQRILLFLARGVYLSEFI